MLFHKKLHDKRSIKQASAIVAVFTVVALLIALFCLRGWIRNDLVPAYVERTHGKQLAETSQRLLPPVHEQLAVLGFEPMRLPTTDKVCWKAYFQGFKESVECRIDYSARILAPTVMQKSKLQNHGDDVEAWLDANGWQREAGYTGITLSEIASTRSPYASIFYQKRDAKAVCQVWVSWHSNESYGEPYLSAGTSCVQWVRFFGGNIYTAQLAPILSVAHRR